MNYVMFLAENEHEKLDELRAAEYRRIPKLIHHCWPPYALASWSVAAPCRFNPTLQLTEPAFLPPLCARPSSSLRRRAHKDRHSCRPLDTPAAILDLADATYPNRSSVSAHAAFRPFPNASTENFPSTRRATRRDRLPAPGPPNGSAASTARRSAKILSTLRLRYACCSVLPSGNSARSSRFRYSSTIIQFISLIRML